MKKVLFTMMAVVLLLGMTGCNNSDNPITYDIEALEQSLVGMWWDEYDYQDVTEDGVPFTKVLLFVGVNEDHTGCIYLGAFDNTSDEAVVAYEAGFRWALTSEGRVLLSDPDTGENAVLSRTRGGSSYGNEMTNVSGTNMTYTNGSVTLTNASYSGTLKKASAQQQTAVKSRAYYLPKRAQRWDIGKLICTEGHLHRPGVNDLCDAERVAMLAYLEYSYGLAIALKESNRTQYSMIPRWLSDYPPVVGCTWQVPSVDDWKKMFRGCEPGESRSQPERNAWYRTDFESKLKEAGSKVLTSDPSGYVTSTEDEPGKTVWYHSYYGTDFVRFLTKSIRETFYLRPCLKFPRDTALF